MKHVKATQARFDKWARATKRSGKSPVKSPSSSRAVSKSRGGGTGRRALRSDGKDASTRRTRELVGSSPTPATKFWLLWAPASLRPPSMRMFTEAEAEKVAKKMVVQSGREFYVLEAKSHHRPGPPIRERIKTKAPKGARARMTVRWSPGRHGDRPPPSVRIPDADLILGVDTDHGDQS